MPCFGPQQRKPVLVHRIKGSDTKTSDLRGIVKMVPAATSQHIAALLGQNMMVLRP